MHCSHSSGRRCEDTDRPEQVHAFDDDAHTRAAKGGCITSVRTSGCVQTRLSEHVGPISLPPHTPLAAELGGETTRVTPSDR
eukprot:7125510-Prymnesium_polylepis.1